MTQIVSQNWKMAWQVAKEPILLLVGVYAVVFIAAQAIAPLASFLLLGGVIFSVIAIIVGMKRGLAGVSGEGLPILRIALLVGCLPILLWLIFGIWAVSINFFNPSLPLNPSTSLVLLLASQLQPIGLTFFLASLFFGITALVVLERKVGSGAYFSFALIGRILSLVAILVLAAFIATALIAGGLLWLEKVAGQQGSSLEQPQQFLSAGEWKTYNNDRYNYTFRYPQEANLREYDDSVEVRLSGDSKYGNTYFSFFINSEEDVGQCDDPFPSISGKGVLAVFSTEQFFIQQAYKEDFEFTIQYKTSQGEASSFLKDNVCFTVGTESTFSPTFQLQERREAESLFEQTLSSFGFSSKSELNKLTQEELSQRKLECKNIQNYFDQNDCYGNLAIDANDPSICPKFGSGLCKHFIFMWHTDLCSDIPIKKPIFGFDKDQATFRDLDKKEECIKKIAIETKNAELCGNLFGEAGDCENTVALELNDPSKCSGFPEDCVMKIAINKKDITICQNKYNKAWCVVAFPKLLQGSLTGHQYDQSCYRPPLSVGYGYGTGKPSYNYSYPNTYDAGENDYPIEIAPESDFYHLLSVPFNSNSLLRVYTNRNEALALLRLVKYFRSSKTSELLGDIRSENGANWSGIYIPIALSKDDNHIIFKAQMGEPGAGGGSITMGYASLSLTSIEYDECRYITPRKIANQVYFYDNFSKALFYSEEKMYLQVRSRVPIMTLQSSLLTLLPVKLKHY